MNILIRLPNWLGDMVMSTAFVKAVSEEYPHASIDLIAKKGIDVLLDYFPAHNHRFVFSKDEYKGLNGAWRFGKAIFKQKKYDLFFCLPDSISSAVMGYAIAAKKRVGYKKELRSTLLTHSYTRKKNIHRVEEYINLLEQFTGKTIRSGPVKLNIPVTGKNDSLLINVNSEAVSRRLPLEKAVSIIDTIRNKIPGNIILIGSNKEKKFVDSVFETLADKDQVSNMAGKTNLQELIVLLASAKAVLTTDSGPAHVANAASVPCVILFGAGNEKNTAPYNIAGRSVIRLGQLACEPCVSNTCKVYGIPECLLRLDEDTIAQELFFTLKPLQ